MSYVLFAITAPWSLTVGWSWVLLMRLFAATDLRWEPGLVLTAEWRPWAARIWRYSTTLGRGIIYQSRHREAGKWTSIQAHEHVHIRQIEDAMALSLVLGLIVGGVTGNWWLGAVLWWSGGMHQLPNFLTAMLRGGNAYRDSEHERSAYAQTDRDAEGRDWLDKKYLKIPYQ